MEGPDLEIARLLSQPVISHLVQARPCWFPPSVNPPFEYKNGVAVRKRVDMTTMTKEVWKAHSCDGVQWLVIIVESMPNGECQLHTDGRPATMPMSPFGGKGARELFFSTVCCAGSHGSMMTSLIPSGW
jgi:hypothetical protein